MTIEWDRTALAVTAGMVARSAALGALPVFQKAAGQVQLRVDGTNIVAGQDGMDAEYRDNKPWIFQGIAAMQGAARGNHQ